MLYFWQIKNLQAEVVSLKREDTETPKAITADLEELRSMCYFGLCSTTCCSLIGVK